METSETNVTRNSNKSKPAPKATKAKIFKPVAISPKNNKTKARKSCRRKDESNGTSDQSNDGLETPEKMIKL